jgi:hypothetical protein
MIRWIYRTKPGEETPTTLFWARLGIQEVTETLCIRRLRWYGQVMRFSTCINTITKMKIPCPGKRGRHRKTWSQFIKEDLRSGNLSENDPRNRTEWKLDARRSGRLLSTPVAGVVAAEDK